MKNRIEEISQNDLKKMLQIQQNDKNEYVVILHMKYISFWEQFAEALGNAFQLPMRSEGVDGTRDWMEDLNWLSSKVYKVVLVDFVSIRSEKLKNIIYDFWQEVIGWWTEDVLRFCVGGERKDFRVYIAKE